MDARLSPNLPDELVVSIQTESIDGKDTPDLLFEHTLDIELTFMTYILIQLVT